MSWGRIDYDGKAGWPATLAALQTAGVELPLGLAVVDLRWWQDRILAPGSTEELPSLDKLAERWCWVSRNGKPSVKRVRLLLQRDAEWSDPYRLEAWRALRGEDEGHDEGTGRAREGHGKGTPGHADTPDIVVEGHDEGTTRAREGHDEGNARDPLPPSPPPSPSRGEPPPPPLGVASAPPPPAAPSPELQAAELLALQQRDEPQHGTGQPRDHDALRRALGRGVSPEALAALWAWSGVSEDPLVGACRTGGWRRWSSLLRQPTGDERLRAASAWHAAGRPTEQRARGRPTPTSGLPAHLRRDPGPPPDLEPATDDDLDALYRDHPELRPQQEIPCNQ